MLQISVSDNTKSQAQVENSSLVFTQELSYITFPIKNGESSSSINIVIEREKTKPKEKVEIKTTRKRRTGIFSLCGCCKEVEEKYHEVGLKWEPEFETVATLPVEVLVPERPGKILYLSIEVGMCDQQFWLRISDCVKWLTLFFRGVSPEMHFFITCYFVIKTNGISEYLFLLYVLS